MVRSVAFVLLTAAAGFARGENPGARKENPEAEYRRQLTTLRQEYAAKSDAVEKSFAQAAEELRAAAVATLEQLRDSAADFNAARRYDDRAKQLKNKAAPTLSPTSRSRARLQRELQELRSIVPGVGRELLRNPGCEQADAKGRIAYWRAEVGDWVARSMPGRTKTGERHFYAQESKVAVLAQRIDVAGLESLFGQQKTQVTASAQLFCLDQPGGNDDAGEIVVELQDAYGEVLARASTGRIVSRGKWRQFSLEMPIHPKTKSITMKLIARRFGPPGSRKNNAELDDASLQLATMK
ncbi:MAG: hypothetical protein AAF790_05530 [Planctomycetota bacterium]